MSLDKLIQDTASNLFWSPMTDLNSTCLHSCPPSQGSGCTADSFRAKVHWALYRPRWREGKKNWAYCSAGENTCWKPVLLLLPPHAAGDTGFLKTGKGARGNEKVCTELYKIVQCIAQYPQKREALEVYEIPWSQSDLKRTLAQVNLEFFYYL